MISKRDLSLLSSEEGLLYLLHDERPKFEEALKRIKYAEATEKLQIALIKMQHWILTKRKSLLVIVEGGEFAGRGAVIRTFTEHLNPRSVRSVALPKLTTTDKAQWYFQRYIRQLPSQGELVLFDRSWYNRAVVEPVNKFCSQKDYKLFMADVNNFEAMINKNDMIFIKLYLKIDKKTQADRINSVKKNPLRYWELTQVDKSAQKLWSRFIEYEQIMLKETSTEKNPWHIIENNDQLEANMQAIKKVLSLVPYNN